MECKHITNFSTLDAISKALDCQPGDILEKQSYAEYLLFVCVLKRAMWMS